MNNELFNNTRKNTEMSFNISIFNFFMNKYLDTDMTSYTSDEGEKIFDFIKLSKDNASEMNIDDYKKLINKVIDRVTRLYLFKGKKFDKKEVSERIIKSFNSRDKLLTFNTEDLYDKPVKGEKSILLYFDISGKDIVNVLNRIIREFDLLELAYDITIPSYKQMGTGHTDAITIATSPEEYKRVVEVLEKVKEETKEFINDNDYARDNWFGVNTIKDGKKADQVIGASFIKAIDTTINELADSYSDILIDEKSISDYLASETNKDLARQTVYKKLLEKDEALGNKVYELVLLDMKELGLDPDNMFVFDTVNEQLDSLYGKVDELQETKVEEAPTEEENEPKVEETSTEEKTEEQVFDELLSKLEMPSTEEKDIEQTKEIPKITEEVKTEPVVEEVKNTIKEENIEVSPESDIAPLTKEEEIVNDTITQIGEEVSEMITTPVQENVAQTIANLTPEEKVSMANAIDQTQETLEIESKYEGLLDGVEGWSFESLVKDTDGNQITLLEYLEKNNALTKVPFNSLVSLLDGTTVDGKQVTGKKFISKYVLDSLKLNESTPDTLGGLTLEEIMEKYIEKIELPEYGVIYPEGLTAPVKKDKNSLLKKLFKSKRES